MVTLKDKAYIEKIEYRNVKQILNDVREEISGLFQLDVKYASLAQFVRCVVLPYSEEGVLDTSGEIDEWLKHANGRLGLM